MAPKLAQRFSLSSLPSRLDMTLLLKPSGYQGAKETAVAGRVVMVSEQELKQNKTAASQSKPLKDVGMGRWLGTRRVQRKWRCKESGGPLGGHGPGERSGVC